jgi:hypothetical protein
MMDLGRLLLATALVASPLLMQPAPAAAQVSFGIGIGTYPAYPVYPAYPYPYAYYPPPPVYYVPPYATYVPPPPAYSPAPGATAPGTTAPGTTGPISASPHGTTAQRACYAGAYVCPLDRNLTAGDACGCPTPSGQRAWGRVG